MFYGRHSDRFQGSHWGLVIVFVVFVAVVGLAVYLLVRRRPGATMMAGGPPPGVRPPGFGPDPAIDQVRYRYARGELSREEYFRLVGDLGWGGGGPPPPPSPPADLAPPVSPVPPVPPAPPGAGRGAPLPPIA
jgi:uncharacterized membrane protein